MSVPKLRFKDENGQDFPDWEEKKLQDIANVERGKFSVRPRNNPIYFGGSIPFVQTGDIVSADLYLTKFSQTLNEDGLKVSKLFPKETILVTIAANIGDTTITSFEVACTDSVVAIQIFQDHAVPVWLKYAIDTKKEELDSKATQNAQRNINLQVLRPLIFNTPSFKEQTKIADFLITLDEKIAQLTQKGELLARYKKGVMQQLFSQELRFKDEDGRDFPDWETRKLVDLVKIYDGTHMTPDYQESGIPFYSVEHVTSNNFKDTKFIAKEVFEKENKRVKLEKGDILMTRIGDIGTPKYIDWDVEASFYVSLALLKQSKKINSLFLSHYIKTNLFQNELHQRTIHVAFPKKINLGEIGYCLVSYPCHQEQIKIADFLTNIDEKITQLQIYLETVKQYKQGLLQQMFV